jgi:hypothetical protein
MLFSSFLFQLEAYFINYVRICIGHKQVAIAELRQLVQICGEADLNMPEN